MWIDTLIYIVNYLILFYFVAINTSYLILIGISYVYIKKELQKRNSHELTGLFTSDFYKPISILAPAFNEEASIVESVTSLLQLRYPDYEVIVINDGSKDATLQTMVDHFKLKKVDRFVPLAINHKPIKAIYKSPRFPNLIVVDKENGRKADALNAGINVARNNLVCAIDADSILEPNVLKELLKMFEEDESTVAVGGIVRVANGCEFRYGEVIDIKMPPSALASIQAVEYLRAFLFGRAGWDALDSLLIISGAFGIFDRQAVMRVGGYLHDTVGEDMELIVRLHRWHREHKVDYKIRFVAHPVCWTEVPESLKVLSRQRNRWQRGLADTLWRHKNMIANPKYGKVGMLAMPFFVFFELLGPIIEIIGIVVVILSYLFGYINTQFMVLFLMASVLLGIIMSVSAILCEELTYRKYTRLRDLTKLIAFAFFENIGFRQLHALWRFRGIIDFLKGNKDWGTMTRKGFTQKKSGT
jgi:cellulose synthase/poly-beta-1,6-N-acetylglucosamine synthase-like glycosyltransferase